MAHPNSTQVIGGIEQPRFLIVGDELSPNISFEESLAGISGTADFSREFNASTPFLDYVLKIEDASAAAQQYIEITIETGAAIAEKRFIVYSFVRNEADSGAGYIWCTFQGLSGTHEKEYAVDAQWKRLIVHEVVVPGDAVGTQLVYRIYPTAKAAGVAGTGSVLIDDFHCRLVTADYEMPVPDRGKYNEGFPETIQAEHRLANGSWKKYRRGFDFLYEAGYEKLTAAQEFVRTQIAKTDREMVFFPHKDSANCYLMKWDREFSREWAFGTAALGHKGDVFLRAQEIIYVLPTDIIDALTIYEYEDDLLYGGGDGYE